ncbi:DUF6851 domain-containing protein [Streptomyces sp. NPDC004227]
MTNSRRLRRRRLGRVVTMATAVAVMGSLTSALPASSQEAAGFDLDHGNALIDVVYKEFNPVSRELNFGRSVSLTVDRAMLVEMPWFDAIAPYHPTAVGIFSNLGRRPKDEQTTRNRNIAVLYSAYTSFNAVLPQYKPKWLEMMKSAGLDPDNTAEDPTTPSGIGILAARSALAARMHDGSNRDGDEGGRKYNRQPYADYTGYKPVNSAYELHDPSRWQPNVSSANNVFKIQEFATPQYGRLKPFSYDSPARFKVSPPVKSNYHNRKAYKEQADEVLKASANLDDRQKAMAEYFNDKVLTYGVAADAVAVKGNYDIEKTVQYVTTSDVAAVDVIIATWYFKRKYDSVRPFSAIHQLYGNKKITAWGGPGKGTVSDITGDEWQSYLNKSYSADHPEYPSATAAMCLVFAQKVRRFTGTDKINLYFPVAKGASVIEPGVTPASDLMLHWSSWTDYAADCGKSRIWAGENFQSAVDAAAQYAPQVGDLSFDFVQRKLNGG